jgi:hypothetical protein
MSAFEVVPVIDTIDTKILTVLKDEIGWGGLVSM